MALARTRDAPIFGLHDRAYAVRDLVAVREDVVFEMRCVGNGYLQCAHAFDGRA